MAWVHLDGACNDVLLTSCEQCRLGKSRSKLKRVCQRVKGLTVSEDQSLLWLNGTHTACSCQTSQKAGVCRRGVWPEELHPLRQTQ